MIVDAYEAWGLFVLLGALSAVQKPAKNQYLFPGEAKTVTGARAVEGPSP